MTSQVHAPAVVGELVMAAMVELAPAETALRDAFLEAERRGAAVHVVVVAAGSPADDDILRDLVERWADKYPGVQVTTCIRRQIDAAVTLVAETRRSAVAFVPRTSDPASSAVVRALTRRAHCPVIVVDG
jgi:hypothetical protein